MNDKKLTNQLINSHRKMKNFYIESSKQSRSRTQNKRDAPRTFNRKSKHSQKLHLNSSINYRSNMSGRQNASKINTSFKENLRNVANGVENSVDMSNQNDAPVSTKPNLVELQFKNFYGNDDDLSMVETYEKKEVVEDEDKKNRNTFEYDENGDEVHTFLRGFKRYQEEFSNKANSLRG